MATTTNTRRSARQHAAAGATPVSTSPDDTTAPVPEVSADRPAWPLARPAYSSLTAAVQGEAARWNVPGIAVAVFHDGQLQETATGIVSIATKQPLRTDSLFQIGSISKVFATTLAMTLVDEGKLDLDEPVLTYVPDLPIADAEARTTITMRHLLSHSSGLEGDRFADYGRGDDASTLAIAKFGVLEQWFAPGTNFAYCNTGFYLVGLVTERLTGKTWEEALQERVLDPWKLDHTVLFAEDAITRSHAVGHYLTSREAGLTIARPYWNRRHATAAGGVLSTVGDLVRFAQGHLHDGELDGERVLKPETAQLMRTPQIRVGPDNRHYGQGWSLNRFEGHTQIGHGGSTDGFRANLTAIPEHKFVIAQLTNADPGTSAMEQIEAWALEHYLGITHPVPETISLADAELDAYVGEFKRHSMTTSIVREGEHLAATMTAINRDTGKAGEPTHVTLLPIGSKEERAFRVPEGIHLGMVAQFFDDSTHEDPSRLLMRISGRMSVRAGVKPKTRRRSPSKPVVS